MKPAILTEESFRQGLKDLNASDTGLARVLSRWGEPPFWIHPVGFPGLVIAILSQQVSLESANAAFTKLEASLASITPDAFLSLDDRTLKGIGFSRQKASYVRDLAVGITTGQVDLQGLDDSPDHQVRENLIRIRGIGPWTADCYLLFSLRRADVWPPDDLALIRSVWDLYEMDGKPDGQEVDRIAGRWRPWRAVAARILWHYYLCERGRASRDQDAG